MTTVCPTCGALPCDQVNQPNSTPELDLLDEIEEAFWGAYDAAPGGEGVMGAAEFGAFAAALAASGMKAPEAVAKAIGEAGHYGRPRKYKLVPREPGDPL